jgi:pimeloyl-ACP methyl ester carboxylesterase
VIHSAKAAILVVPALFVLGFANVVCAQEPAESCASLTNLQLPETTITSGEAVAAKPKPATPPPGPAYAMNLVDVAMPSYCLAKGEIDKHAGPAGKSYSIGFALALPDKWNGRFLFQGGGGMDGVVRPPLGTQAAGKEPALARGFAVVSMDSGHEGSMFDMSFNRDQEASLDFAYIALGKVTTVAKEIIAKYYGEPAKHSYFVGCSTGGRQAMLAAQRYPLQFDGVVSGDPAMRTGYSRIADEWNAATFNQIAPKNAQGQPISGEAFSDSDKKLLTDSILNECDALDGLKDGMIFNFQACHYNPDVLACKGAKTGACLSSAQVSALQKVFAGPRDSQQIDPYVGRPYDAGVAIYSPGTFGTVLPQSRPGMFGRPNPAMSVDVDALERRAADDPVEALTDTTWTNLSEFSAHGGKLIFFHGLSDPVFSPYDTLRYYNEMAKANGGADEVQSWSRIFLVPGMNHCAGGPALDRFDALGAVVKWVEQGEAPDSIVATGKHFPGVSRPLCAYPKHAQYRGSGDPQDAANFVCSE